MGENDTVIESVNDTADFDRIAQRMVARIEALGSIDYRAIRAELRASSKPLSNSPDPDVLAQDLVRIQAFRDRVTEIVMILTEAYLTHKRVVEVLTGGWTRFSNEKSSEKREGEGLLKFSSFIMAASDAEAAYRHSLGVMRNLESQQENVFQQIRCAIVASRIGQRPYLSRDEADPVTNWEQFDKNPDAVQESKDCGST